MARKSNNKKLTQKSISFWKTNSQYLLWIGGIALVVAAILMLYFQPFSDKLSLKGFNKITDAGEKVLSDVSGSNKILSKKDCQYVRPEKFSGLELFCDVALVSYVPYESDQKTVELAKVLERRASELGKSMPYLNRVYKQPAGSSGSVTVNLSRPLPKKQCTFGVDTKENATKMWPAFPSNSDPNMIALTFSCSSRAHGEYFPVTYRQS